MNERIRELAEQAREYANSSQPYEKIKNKAWIDVYDEKFAELIVRESIVDFYRNCLDTTNNEDITVQVDRYVQEHFGVE